MLIHGARTIVRWADRQEEPLARWIRQLEARRGKNRTIVALANKMARIAWVIVAQGERYQVKKAFSL